MINRQVHIIISIVNLDYLNRILWKLSRYFADSSSGNVIQCSCSSVTTCSSRRLSAPWAGRSRPPGWPGSPAPGRRSAHCSIGHETAWHHVTPRDRSSTRRGPATRGPPSPTSTTAWRARAAPGPAPPPGSGPGTPGRGPGQSADTMQWLLYLVDSKDSL